jgi:5-methylcytosine-specific restriction protein A
MTWKICTAKGCGRPIPVSPRALCDACAEQRRAASALSAAGSSRRWRQIRRLKLMADPLCEVEGCVKVAKVVDHWVARVLGGGDEDTNLISLCVSHHTSKTHHGGPLRLRSRSMRGVTFA